MQKKQTIKKPDQSLAILTGGDKGNLSVENLMQLAIKKDASIDTIERIFSLRDRMKAEWAKQQFDEAMAKFQSECPVIKKMKEGGRTNSGQVAYRYAPLDSIVMQVRELLWKHGFSYAVKTKTGDKSIAAICIVKHQSGHSEESSFEVPSGGGTAIMSEPQKVAAALTFAKRYAFCNAFGIMTGDEDNDAGGASNTPSDAKRLKQISEWERRGETKHLEGWRVQVMKSDMTNQEKMKWAGIINEAIQRITKK